MFEIIHTSAEKDIKSEFVAIGCRINAEGVGYHTLLTICYQDTNYAFHYTGEPTDAIKFDIILKEYMCFHKITDVIHPILIPSLIIMCEKIKENANPKYGYFYSGEYFGKDGTHFSEKPIGEFMTCTGFAINVLKGFLLQDYVHHTDWGLPTTLSEDYIKKFISKTGLKEDDIIKEHRRISPVELLCSGYFSKLPIRKAEVDSKIDEVVEFLSNHK